MLELKPSNIFYGEIGVIRRMPVMKDTQGFLDEDYDQYNPDGSMYGRRNFNETSYYSGSPSLDPSEYRRNFNFYKDYGLGTSGPLTARPESQGTQEGSEL